MKPAHLLVTATFAVFALSVTVWLGRYEGKIPVVETKAVEPTVDASALPIPKEGPFGKAVVSESSFDFGMLEQGAKGSHVFLIKNEGPGPLRVKTGKTSCGQCTFGRVSREDDIPPGETVDVEIKWEIKAPNTKFRQTAEVFTTDPEHPKLEFAILGRVDTTLHLVPEGVWDLSELSETESTTAEGVLYSNVVDQIEIDRVECSSPLVIVTWEPAPASVLAEKQAKSGLAVKVAVAPGTALGPMRETVKLHTKVRDGMAVDFSLTGNRPGPIEVKGRGWNAQHNIIMLGEFPAATGTRTKLSIYVRDLDGELEAEQVHADQNAARVRISSTGRAFGKSKVYDLEVEVPPGPTAVRRHKQAEPVLLKLNHPKVSEFKLYVDYFAR